MNTELYCHYLFQVMKFKCYDDPKLLLRGSRNIPPYRYLDLFLLAPSSIDFRRSLVSPLGEERELLSRTAAGNRAYEFNSSTALSK